MSTISQNFSVILRLESSSDINVSLNDATIQELQQKVPSYDMLSDSYNITFKDKDGCDLEEDDDLQDALDVNDDEDDGEPLLIIVTKTPKQNLSVQQDLESWLKSNKLYTDQILHELTTNDVNELSDLNDALDSESDVNEFTQQLNLKFVLRKKLKKSLLKLISTPIPTVQEPGSTSPPSNAPDPMSQINSLNKSDLDSIYHTTLDWLTDKMNEGQMNINKHIPTEQKHEEKDSMYITCSFPQCGQKFPSDEYDSHALLHTLSGDAPLLVECEYLGCNQKMNVSEYNSHIMVHKLSETNNYNDDNISVTCYHPFCNQKISMNQWEFHQAQHEYDEKKEMQSIESKAILKGWQPVPQIEKHNIDITKKNRTMMVIGATGTGKTTLLNSMVNYLWEVKYGDKYRYKLIYETPKDDNNTNQAMSQTDKVSAYYLDPPVLDYQLTVVDTPGFGDTRGIERDKQIKQNIKEYFETEIEDLDVICFVIRAPQCRLTPTQIYIFNEVLSIFGKDIKDNIFVLFTFADNEDPPALAALEKDNVPYAKHFKLNNSGFKKLFDENNYDYMCASYYEMGIQAFKVFFQEIDKLNAVSLTLTKQVFTRREQLEVYIEGIQPTINLGYSILEGIRKEIVFIEKYADLIDANKDFMIEKEISKARQVDNGGTVTTTCIQCNYTCHKKCAIPDDKDKDRCCAISKGHCKVCPHKCHWMKHRNLPYTVEYYTETVKSPVIDLKNKYYDAKKQQSTSDQLIDGLKDKLNEVEIDLNSLLNNIRLCINELSSIALRPSVLNQGDYIDKLIQSEEIKKDKGWEQRCASLKELKMKQDTLSKVNSNEYDPWSQYKDVKIFLDKKQLNNKDDGKDEEKKEYIEKKKKGRKKKKKGKKKKNAGGRLFSWFG